jgi:hypothetical protein
MDTHVRAYLHLAICPFAAQYFPMYIGRKALVL